MDMPHVWRAVPVGHAKPPAYPAGRTLVHKVSWQPMQVGKDGPKWCGCLRRWSDCYHSWCVQCGRQTTQGKHTNRTDETGEFSAANYRCTEPLLVEPWLCRCGGMHEGSPMSVPTAVIRLHVPNIEIIAMNARQAEIERRGAARRRY